MFFVGSVIRNPRWRIGGKSLRWEGEEGVSTARKSFNAIIASTLIPQLVLITFSPGGGGDDDTGKCIYTYRQTYMYMCIHNARVAYVYIGIINVCLRLESREIERK